MSGGQDAKDVSGGQDAKDVSGGQDAKDVSGCQGARMYLVVRMLGSIWLSGC